MMGWIRITLMVLASAVAVTRSAAAPALVQTLPLTQSAPYFVPTHPRITTTVRFPGPINAPDGAAAVFTEDSARHAGEYLIVWQQGEAHVAITPLPDARMANLNIPYRGGTYVFYFYPVEDPLKAVAALNLTEAAPVGREPPGSAEPRPAAIVRSTAAVPRADVPATAARLVGFLDRLKLIHAVTNAPDLAQLATAMGVEVASTACDALSTSAMAGDGQRATAPLPPGVNDAGLFQVILLRVVRDRRLGCVGFICLVRNTSSEPLLFDVRSFGARVGAEYLPQRISDACASLKPGEQAPAYFVVQPRPDDPLRASNSWKVSLDLVAPRVNPGAAISRRFPSEERKP